MPLETANSLSDLLDVVQMYLVATKKYIYIDLQ